MDTNTSSLMTNGPRDRLERGVDHELPESPVTRGSQEEERGFHEVSAEHSLDFLSAAGRLLSQQRRSVRSLLRDMARLTTAQGLATFCLVDLATTKGHLRRVAAVHQDPHREARLRTLDSHCHSDTVCSPLLDVLSHRSLAPLLELPGGDPPAAGVAPGAARGAGGVSARSCCVPLGAAARAGMLLLARTGSEPPYGLQDLQVAEELAPRGDGHGVPPGAGAGPGEPSAGRSSSSAPARRSRPRWTSA